MDDESPGHVRRRLVLLATLTIGGGTASGAPPVPFSLSPSSVSLSAIAGGYDYEFVTVTTGNKKIALENPATFGAGLPFFDTQAGSCWQSYGAVGLKVPANSTCTIQVGFHPTAAGTPTDVMTVYACKRSHVDSTSGFMICDARDGSQTVGLSGAATAAACSYTAGTSGCIVLDSVTITDSPSTATYTLSGVLTFTPTCQLGATGCTYATGDPLYTGSGTFSVSGSQSASGTWAVPASFNDGDTPYQFNDGSTSTTCAAAAIRQVTPNISLIASDGSTGGGWLTIRQDTAGTTSIVGGGWSTGPLPTGTFTGSLSGVTILC